MYIIGLTGGTGSGKTTVSNYLRKKGFEIIDFDLTTRELEEPGEPALKEIVETFGPEALLPDGTMNRKYVGRIVFSDPEEKKAGQNHTKICGCPDYGAHRPVSRGGKKCDETDESG